MAVNDALKYGQIGSDGGMRSNYGYNAAGTMTNDMYGNPLGGGSNSSLYGNIGDYMSSPDFMGGMGDLMGGVAGLGGLYLGYQQMKETKKNNSLYRSIQNEQQNQANDFQNETNAVFGNTGRTNWQASGVRS